MRITRQTVAEKIADYLHHKISLTELVDWAERSICDAELTEGDEKILVRVLAQIGVADVRTFGLTWEDCEQLLGMVGFAPRVEVVAA